MKVMNSLVKLPELANDMQELSMEFMKAGIMDEMVQDVIEMDDDELEEEADEEVDKVLIELTQGMSVLLGLLMCRYYRVECCACWWIGSSGSSAGRGKGDRESNEGVGFYMNIYYIELA
jgi:hypothetical protein